jgi:hypothetical protein
MAAADALIAMTAQCRGAASDDGIEHLAMRPCKMRLLLFPESIARSTDDVGHLEGGSAHRLIFLLERFTSSEQIRLVLRYLFRAKMFGRTAEVLRKVLHRIEECTVL